MARRGGNGARYGEEMIIRVQFDGSVSLEEAHDMKRFSITGTRPDAAGIRRLADAGLELTADGGHGFVAPRTLRQWAEGLELPDAWPTEFAAMVAYATAKGWTDDEGRLRGHTEWGHSEQAG